MNPLKSIPAGIFLAVAVSAGFSVAHAEDKTAERPSFVKGSVELQEFVEKAAASGIAEVEMAKLALSKSTLEEVRHFAQIMLEDHTAANQELRKLAAVKGITIGDELTLVKKAKGYFLEMREGALFNDDYANAQLKAHTETLELFRKAANSSDEDLKKFADALVPTLEHHFSMAETLVDTVAKSNSMDTTPNAADKQ
jgi:putative membrane protein